MYLEHPADKLTRSAMKVWIELAASKAIRAFSGAVRLFITTNPFSHVSTSHTWANMNLRCMRMSMSMDFRSPLSLQKQLLHWICFHTTFWQVVLCEIIGRRAFKSNTANQQAFLGTASVRMLIHLAIFMSAWFKTTVLWRGKMTFRIILPICHFPQPDELLPLPPFGFGSLTMHQKKCPGKRSAFATDLWSWLKQQGSQYTSG